VSAMISIHQVPDHLAGAQTKEVVSMDEMLTGRLLYNSGLRVLGIFAELSHVNRLPMPRGFVHS
jgi:hypothetical protein